MVQISFYFLCLSIVLTFAVDSASSAKRSKLNRGVRQVSMDAGSSTLAVDSLGTPVITTQLDALGGSSIDTSGFGMTVVDPTGLGMETGLVTSGVTASLGEAVGNYNVLSTMYNFIPLDTSASLYILPPNLQAFIPDQLFLATNPPLYTNYQFACDIYGTGMCYFYYF